MSHAFFVSAYATTPSFQKWDAQFEEDYFKLLAADKRVLGIEHPFLPNSDSYSLPWLKQHMPEHWSIIITGLPAVMQAGELNPYFGLASVKEEERLQAVALIEKLNRYAHELNDAFGREVVKAVHLHSSPRNIADEKRGYALAFKQSLKQIVAMDWGNTQLNLEHCDAYIAGQVPDKGFLTLPEEIAVIKEVGQFGVVLNWGRSAIEARSAQGPLTHLQLLQEHGLLNGFFFSGCSKLSRFQLWTMA